MCGVDVSAGVCPATGGQAWGEALLSSLRQHSTAGQGRPSHEGTIILIGLSLNNYVCTELNYYGNMG